MLYIPVHGLLPFFAYSHSLRPPFVAPFAVCTHLVTSLPGHPHSLPVPYLLDTYLYLPSSRPRYHQLHTYCIYPPDHKPTSHEPHHSNNMRYSILTLAPFVAAAYAQETTVRAVALFPCLWA